MKTATKMVWSQKLWKKPQENFRQADNTTSSTRQLKPDLVSESVLIYWIFLLTQPLALPPSLSVCLCLYVSLCLSVSPLSLSVSLPVCLCIYVSLSVCLSVCLSVSPPPPLSPPSSFLLFSLSPSLLSLSLNPSLLVGSVKRHKGVFPRFHA